MSSATKELTRIKQTLKDTFEGNAWHGKSLMAILKGLTFEEALMTPIPGKRSIWEMLLHIMVWRTATYKRLAEGIDFHIKLGSLEDWPKVENPTEEGWISTLDYLRKSQDKLFSALDEINDDLLDAEVGKNKYSYYQLIHGVIQHDIYHGGQIALMRTLLPSR